MKGYMVYKAFCNFDWFLRKLKRAEKKLDQDIASVRVFSFVPYQHDPQNESVQFQNYFFPNFVPIYIGYYISRNVFCKRIEN